MTLSQPLTLQPYPHEQVWLKGSQMVTDWTASGSRSWSHGSWPYVYAPDADSQAVDPAYPLADDPDLVVFDGKELTEVGSLSDVTSQTFFVDRAQATIYLGDDPTGHTVEVGALRHGILIEGTVMGLVLRGLGFAHYINAYQPGNDTGAVVIYGAGVTVVAATFARNTSVGLVLYATGAVVTHSVFAYNGLNGAGGYAADNMVFAGNAAAYNNTRHYAVDWAAAGAKFSTTIGATIRDNLFEQNLATGLWFDISSNQNTVIRNRFASNTTGMPNMRFRPMRSLPAICFSPIRSGSWPETAATRLSIDITTRSSTTARRSSWGTTSIA